MVLSSSIRTVARAFHGIGHLGIWASAHRRIQARLPTPENGFRRHGRGQSAAPVFAVLFYDSTWHLQHHVWLLCRGESYVPPSDRSVKGACSSVPPLSGKPGKPLALPSTTLRRTRTRKRRRGKLEPHSFNMIFGMLNNSRYVTPCGKAQRASIVQLIPRPNDCIPGIFVLSKLADHQPRLSTRCMSSFEL